MHEYKPVEYNAKTFTDRVNKKDNLTYMQSIFCTLYARQLAEPAVFSGPYPWMCAGTPHEEAPIQHGIYVHFIRARHAISDSISILSHQ